MPLQNYLVPAASRPSIAQLSNTPSGLDLSQVDRTTLSAPQQQALQTLATLQQRLLDGAQAFFADYNDTARPALNLDQPLILDAPDRLAAQLAGVPGIACGGRPPYRVGLQRLIDALPAHKQHGVATLYIAGLSVELHQADLDRYGAKPDAEMPQALRAALDTYDQQHALSGGVSLHDLLANARRQGLRLMALDSVASRVTLAPLTERVRQEISNYSAFLRISEDQQPTRGRWLAWLAETQLNRFEDVAGIAELTGGIGLRLQLAEEPVTPSPQHPLRLRLDPGEQVVKPNGERYWVKSDLLLTAQPSVDQAALASQLQQAGQYAILARPDTGEWQLTHRSNDQSLANTPIQRDTVTPSLLFIDRPSASTSWRQMKQGRFQDLSALRTALEGIVKLSPAWPGLTPVLVDAEVAPAPRAGRLSPPMPRPSPPSPADAYLLTPDEAKQLQDRNGVINTHVARRLLQIRARLLADAERVHSQAILPARPMLPVFRPDLPLGQVHRLLLDRYPGIVMGETHDERWAISMLIEQLPMLCQNGVRTLYLENIVADAFQAQLEKWNASPPNTPMPFELDLNLYHAEYNSSELMKLVKLAHEQGIAVVAIDCHASRNYKSSGLSLTVPQRMKLMNHYAMLRIRSRQAEVANAKWVALTGSAHANEHAQVHGIAELTGAVGLRISGAPLSVQPDVGTRYINDRFPDDNDRFTKTDLVATFRPTLLDSEINARLQTRGDFALVYTPTVNSEGFELRYRGTTEIETWPFVYRDGTFSLPDSPWLELRKQRFKLVKELNETLTRQSFLGGMPARNVWPDVTPQSIDTLPLPQREWFLAPEEMSRLQLSAFERQRQATLLRMLFLASQEERAAFKAGRADWQAELATLDLAADVPLARLQQVFTQRDTLSPRQQGALLAAIRQRQVADLAQVTRAWHARITEHGGTALRTIAHNRYLAAANHQQGLCAGLSAHLAAAYLVDAAAGSAFDHYLDALEAATREPDTPTARLLDLSLVAWRFAEPELVFAANPSHVGLSVAGVLDILASAPLPAAFELSLGSHALLLAKGGAPGAETFLLADPNFGRCQFASREALSTVLEWHGTLVRKLFASDTADTLPFSLRRYRADLAAQKLFAAQSAGSLESLTLADLARPDALATRLNASRKPLEQRQSFQHLQRRLSVLEYRQSLQQLNEIGLADRALAQLLARHQTPRAAQYDYARVIMIEFKGQDAFATLADQTGQVYPPLKIDGKRYPADVAVLRQFDDLRREVVEGNDDRSRLKKLLLPRTPAFVVDRHMLTGALPDKLRSHF